MSEKVAVRCRSLSDVERVIEKHPRFNHPAGNVWNSCYKEDGAICINSESQGWQKEAYWVNKNYRIIEASEYLGGGESVKQEFKVGDEVECIAGHFSVSGEVGEVMACSKKAITICFPSCKKWTGVPESYKLVSNTKKEEVTMRKTSIEVYEKTADAVLMDKWATKMGLNDNFSDVLFVRQNKVEFLKEAKRLQAEQDNS